MASKKETSAEPFSIEHFEWWGSRLVLDSGELWKLEPFQLAFVEDVFKGFRECWLVVPEGNGKTTLIAGLALYGLRYSEEPMIPIAASSRDQVRIMYRQAKGFVRRSKVNTEKLWFDCFDGYRRVDLRAFDPRNRRGQILGSMEVHAADAGTGDGVIPYPFAILDELHRHSSLDLYNTWRGKLGKRNGQLLTISTAGAPASEFEDMREKIRLSGKQKAKRQFVRVTTKELVMHEHAVRGDPADLKLVAEANPFAQITPKTLAAKKATPTMTDAHWLRFTCNIAAQTDSELFIDPVSWKLCAHEFEIPAAASICIGADGSRTWDTTVIAWATALEEQIDVGCRVFSVRPDVPHHVLHEGGKIDFDDVEAFLIDLFDRFAPLETAYDPRYLERSMEIVDQRLPSASIFPVEPSSKHARDAYQALYEAVAGGKLRHDGDPVIEAHLGNCTVDRDDRNNEIRRLRKIDPRKPIDAVPALALAVWRATLASPSVYEDREMVLV